MVETGSAPRSILVVRLSSIGDLVHTLPAVAALRRHFPEARIDWLVEARHKDVLLDNPDVDELIEVDTLGWRRRLLRLATWREITGSLARIRARRYDAVLDLQGTIKSSVSAFLARGDRRIGFAASHLKERPAGWLYRERVEVNVNVNGTTPHVIDRHLRLLTALGIEEHSRSFPITAPEASELEASRWLAKEGLFDYVVVNPGGSWVTKRWSPDKFGAVVAAIERDFGLATLVVWGPGEEALARSIVNTSSRAQLAPPTSFREMIPYVRRAKLFVSGDTGPMHLASAFGVPVVAIFGPTDPARNGPFGSDDEIVMKPVPCGPCYKKKCPGYGNVCMTEIEVNDVMGAVKKKLSVLQ